MSLNHAFKFMEALKSDKELRKMLYCCNTAEQLEQQVMDCGYHFSIHELEDVYRKKLLECQAQSEASELTELFNMYRFLLGLSPVSLAV